MKDVQLKSVNRAKITENTNQDSNVQFYLKVASILCASSSRFHLVKHQHEGEKQHRLVQLLVER